MHTVSFILISLAAIVLLMQYVPTRNWIRHTILRIVLWYRKSFFKRVRPKRKPKLRIHHTIEPDERLAFNDMWLNVKRTADRQLYK